MKTCVFAGSFDPFTVGHLDVVKRAARLFDKAYVTVLYNPGKDRAMFSVEERVKLIQDAVSDIENVAVSQFSGLLVDYCRSIGASCIVRGIRSGSDVEYEHMLEAVNKKLDDSIETLYMLSKPEYAHMSSSLVRQLIELNIGIEDMVPNAMHDIIQERTQNDGRTAQRKG